MAANESPLSQFNRLFYLETPLGKDKLLVRGLKGTEEISKIFHFTLDLVSEDFNIAYDQIMGQNITVGIKYEDQQTIRYLNGHVARFAQTPYEGRLAIYEAEVVPWLWFLTRTADCYIYQNKTVPEIIDAVFARFGFQDYEWQLQASYTPWEYCVQYRETAANFVMRLMEIEGIFFFFRHEKGKHTLVMGDSPSVHKPCPYQSQVRYEMAGGRGFMRQEDRILRWKADDRYRSGKYTHTDYNYLTPSTNLLAGLGTREVYGGNTRYELFDFPGEYEKRPEGEFWARLRMEEEELPHRVVFGESNCRALYPGFRFELIGHERDDQNGPYVVTSIAHDAHEGGFYTGIGSGEERYHNSFTCIPYSVQFRPPRITPKPLVHGTQTAFVVGPKGEEIYTDKYGRVKVQFHWDRVGKHDENSSCWIRVSQPWAGKNWGAIWIPRIGQEVIVDFLEGDPDRPIITGRVYNAELMPPYELPANQTVSGFKSRSSKKGTPRNYNEIRFEDKKGQELLLLHAERDLEAHVEHDVRELVEDRMSVQVGTIYVLQAGQEIHLIAPRIILDAEVELSIGGPAGGFFKVDSSGVYMSGPMAYINSGGSHALGSSAVPLSSEGDTGGPLGTSGAAQGFAEPLTGGGGAMGGAGEPSGEAPDTGQPSSADDSRAAGGAGASTPGSGQAADSGGTGSGRRSTAEPDPTQQAPPGPTQHAPTSSSGALGGAGASAQGWTGSGPPTADQPDPNQPPPGPTRPTPTSDSDPLGGAGASAQGSPDSGATGDGVPERSNPNPGGKGGR